MKIADKTFVVTGAGNGIGREVALELLRRGARVAGVDISDAALSETAALAAAAERFSEHPVDLADRDRVGELPAEIEASHGPIDGLINDAGLIPRFVPFAELSIEDMAQVIDVTARGTVNITKSFLDVLLARPEA